MPAAASTIPAPTEAQHHSCLSTIIPTHQLLTFSKAACMNTDSISSAGVLSLGPIDLEPG